ncbi:MAG TPA: alpha-L-arabinofuranosidase [Bacteroidota bacterium]|nr:alpha-L-arabinofuranosidase [Bacteroidota bacterium]
MKPILSVAATVLLLCSIVSAQSNPQVSIVIKSDAPSGIIDSKIYGQLFEHIYFSADGGLCAEMISERSFEPEQYNGMPKGDGYFDGWTTRDNGAILVSPTLFDHPIVLADVDDGSFTLSTEVKWRSYKLERHMWSGGFADMRVEFRNITDSTKYRFRLHDPRYESSFGPTPQQAKEAVFAIERETRTERRGRDGVLKRVSVWEPVKSVPATKEQLEPSEGWHTLRLVSTGDEVTVFWDGVQILACPGLTSGMNHHAVGFSVNYTAAEYRKIKIASVDGKRVYLEGMPAVLKNPAVAPQWKSFGTGKFEMVKGDAINMDYSQKITSGKTASGLMQGPFRLKAFERYLGSLWAKGDGKAKLAIGFTSGGKKIASHTLGTPTASWRKYDFTLEPKAFEGDADVAIEVTGCTVLIDQLSMMPKSGIDLGGFRPDLFKAVRQLGPTCLRWPGGGFAAQYSWKWGVGPQEKRTRLSHWMWQMYDQSEFGTDEFIRLCREINSEPVLVVRIGFDRPQSEHAAILQEACDWVAYCNEPSTGKWGAVRAANGHPEPYNVKYWEIDNEMWEMGLAAYEASVREFSAAMRAVDPKIKIIVCGGFRPDGDKGFFERSGTMFDYVSLHHYEGQNGYASGPGKLATQYEQYADMIAHCPNPNLKLFISEWNLQSIDWRTGLFAASFLNMCEAHPIVEMGAAALFIRRTDAPDWNNAFINFDYQGLFTAPNYVVTKLWHDNFSKYRLAYTGATDSLSVMTTLSENGEHVIVKLVNPTEHSYELTIGGDWKSLKGARYASVEPGSLHAANSMQAPDAVSVTTREITPRDTIVVLTVAPLSAGVLTLKK